MKRMSEWNWKKIGLYTAAGAAVMLYGDDVLGKTDADLDKSIVHIDNLINGKVGLLAEVGGFGFAAVKTFMSGSATPIVVGVLAIAALHGVKTLATATFTLLV